MVKTTGDTNTRIFEGLRRSDSMHDDELSWKTENRTHIASAGLYLVQGVHTATFLLLQNALHRVAVIAEKRVIAYRLLTLFKKDTLASSIA